ncbi:MAG: hypothetical protein Q9201_002733 [Fulgogasparrea decipioides]
MESLSFAVTIIQLVDASAKASQRLLQLTQKNDELERIGLEVSLSLQKIKLWRENWSGEVDSSDLSATTLWGTQGWATIRVMLESTIELSKEIETRVREAQEVQTNLSRQRWRRAMERVGKKGQTRPRRELRHLAAELNKSVDALWIYTETRFDFLHGPLAVASKPAEKGTLLDLGLQSRAGSMRLYTLCLAQAEDFNLELDMLQNSSAWQNLSFPRRNAPPLRYPLVTEAGEKELQRLVVENLGEIDIVSDEKTEMIDPTGQDFQLFRPRSVVKFVKVPQHSLDEPQYLRIPSRPSKIDKLVSAPESLVEVLGDLKRRKHVKDLGYLSRKGDFDAEAKIKLAVMVAKCGFFLLGTPWFSSLNSRNLRRLSEPTDQSLAFILRTQTLDLRDLVSDDPGALAETSQLFRLGVLLMEIALETPETDFQTAYLEHDPKRLAKLPLVERAMGVQYCKATAFCLQHRKHRFSEPEKYDGKLYDEWETYMAGFLQDYYSQVLLRQALQPLYTQVPSNGLIVT